MYKKIVLNTYGKNMTPELCGIILVIRVNY
jgi:hypothetical protein